MATDLEKLVVQLSADFKSYENAMAKASGITRKELAGIKAQAETAGNGAVVAFTGASKGVQRFGSEAKRAQASVSALRAQTGNLAAQFQDIAVQLQMGQSPFQVALQQGTQISSVLGGQGARGAVTALAGAFTSLISPVSLVTIGIIAAGGAAVQYFSSLLSGGEKSAEELRRQSALIQQVAKDWGAAVPAIAAYAAEIERTQKIADLQSVGDVVLTDIWAKATEGVSDLQIRIVEIISLMQDMGASADEIRAIQTAFNALSEAVDEQRATGGDAKAVQEALNGSVMAATPLVQDLSAAFGGLVPLLDSTATSSAAAAASLDAQAASLLRAAAAVRDYQASRQLAEAQSKASLDQRTSGLAATEDSRNSNNRGVNLTYDDRQGIARYRDSLAGSGGGGRKAAASDADREREAVAKLIEQLRFEQTLVGMTAEQKEVANTLRRAGAAATAEERAQIEALVLATYAQTEALSLQKDQLENLQALSRDVLGGMFEDMRNGAKGADLLANALNRVAESLVSAGIDSLTSGVFKAGDGGGGFLAAIGSFLTGRRERGGPVRAGGAYLVGEKRPEVFVPNRNGYIIPQVPKAIAAAPAAPSGALSVRVYIDDDGNLQAMARREAGPIAAEVVRRTAPSVVAQANERGGR